MRTLYALMIALALSLPAEADAVGLFGDANRDGSVTMADAIAVAEVVMGFEPLGSIHPVSSDVNCDGRRTMVDALIIAQHVEFGGEFPCL